MATPLGGMSDGMGILSLLSGVGQGYMQGQQTQYQRAMARNEFEANQDYKMAMANAAGLRAGAYSQHVGDEGTHYGNEDATHDANSGQHLMALLGNGVITPQEYSVLASRAPSVPAGSPGTAPGAPGDAGPSSVMFPGDTSPEPVANQAAPVTTAPPAPAAGAVPVAAADPGMGVGPKAQAAIAAQQAGTTEKTAQANSLQSRTGATDAKSLLAILAGLGTTPASEQPTLVQSINSENANTPGWQNLPVPGVTVVGRRTVPVSGPPALGDYLAQGGQVDSRGYGAGGNVRIGLAPTIVDLLAQPYAPDLKTLDQIKRHNVEDQIDQARIPEITNLADLTRVRANLAPGIAQSQNAFRAGMLANGANRNSIYGQAVNNGLMLGEERNGIAQQNATTNAGRAQSYEAGQAGKSGGMYGYGSQYDQLQARRQTIQKRITELTTPSVSSYPDPMHPGQTLTRSTAPAVAIQGAAGDSARAELAQLKARDQAANEQMYKIKRGGGSVSSLYGTVPNADGQPGCADSVCLMARQLGLPVPNTRNARQLEAGLPGLGWTSVPLGQAQEGDIIAMDGTGPSGRHVGIALGNGMMAHDPGKSTHNTIEPTPIPDGRNMRAYRYVGGGGR